MALMPVSERVAIVGGGASNQLQLIVCDGPAGLACVGAKIGKRDEKMPA